LNVVEAAVKKAVVDAQAVAAPAVPTGVTVKS
jgi:hypothetical protein